MDLFKWANQIEDRDLPRRVYRSKSLPEANPRELFVATRNPHARTHARTLLVEVDVDVD